ncbi:MAG: hypothetical protein ABI599_17435 [Flavobacteriales bacterium]
MTDQQRDVFMMKVCRDGDPDRAKAFSSNDPAANYAVCFTLFFAAIAFSTSAMARFVFSNESGVTLFTYSQSASTTNSAQRPKERCSTEGGKRPPPSSKWRLQKE